MGCHWNPDVPFNEEKVVMLQREGEWSCYGGGQFKGGRMVMLQRWPIYRRKNGHVTEVVSLMEGVVMLQRWPG